MVVVVAEGVCTSVAAERLLGAIYSRSMGKTRNSCSDPSNRGFAASYCCCMGHSMVCCGYCLVAPNRKSRDNRLQTMSTVMIVGRRRSNEGESRPYSWEGSQSWTSRSSQQEMG